jgi:hypothetical protein
MGRYYSGDIEGKFWFGSQSSDDADNFGVTGTPPDSHLNYHFREKDLPNIEKGLEVCESTLNDLSPFLLEIYHEHNFCKSSTEWKTMYDTPPPKLTFPANTSLKTKLRSQSVLLTEDQINLATEVYARLILGRKIYMKVVEDGECFFEAEL